MSWADNCDRFIEALVKDLPPDATLEDRKRLLRENAGRFHEGTSWGRKVWSKRARAHLELYGLPKRTLGGETRLPPGKLAKRLADGDIIFPFRNQP